MTIFTALADPKRREILDLLREGERPAGAIVARVDLAQPTVSQHLKVLREAGLVSVRADANRRVYRLRPAGLLELDAWLTPYRRLWADRLDALELHLDQHPDPTHPPKGTTS
ncbi:MAG: winged helix-turn-helix transcriptional regulator [Actinobacteria bacterium]|nr:winged helix-turn-helix transcriptional regulator [Actinomycetota bacterium]